METILIGIGATAVMDAWGVLRARLFDVPAANYGLVGRWLAYVAQGRFRHDPISASPPLPGERAIGWTAHYLIGIAFAGLLLAIAGPAWLREPRLGPAIAVGLATVAAPFLVMQPGMGAGFFASRTRNPAAARLQSVLTHLVFGLGLYLAGLALALVRVA